MACASRRKKLNPSSHRLTGLNPLASTLSSAHAKPMREDQAHIAGRPRIAHRAQPAQLVIDEAAPRVGRHARLHNFRAQRHAIAGSRHAHAHLVVVGQLIHQGKQAAGFFQRLAPHRQRGTQTVVQPALDQFRKQHAGNEIRGNAQRFKPRGDGAVRAPAIERRHQADRRPCPRRALPEQSSTSPAPDNAAPP